MSKIFFLLNLPQPTLILGDVLSDIIDAFKEIENIKLELAKVFINEVIIPLESKVEIQIGNTKVKFFRVFYLTTCK